jgi:predicted dehydrogenase
MLKTPLTNVDRSTFFTVAFSSSGLAAQAILSCSITRTVPESDVIIQFERGTITISAPIYCPKKYTVQYFDKSGAVEREEQRVFEYVGKGLHFQADEVARCVRDGKKESELWGHNKSLLEMEIFDEVDSPISDYWGARTVLMGVLPLGSTSRRVQLQVASRY